MKGLGIIYEQNKKNYLKKKLDQIFEKLRFRLIFQRHWQ